MALCTMHFGSGSLGKQEAMNVIVPDGRGPYPVLYLLHGLSDDYTIWSRRTSIERYLEGRRLIVVMPDTHRFFYVNDPRPGGLAYEDHLLRDVIGTVDNTFPTIRSRRSRAVAGLSMGGYGAMMMGLRHADKFSAAVSHSGAFGFAQADFAERLSIPDAVALSEALPAGEYDVFELAKRHAGKRSRVALRFDCGTDDGLLDVNRRFHAHLDELGIPHEYAEHPGGHGWDYWDAHVRETLDFVCDHVRRK